ncbi:HNH endonuclease [Mycobacterium montefiorense]|uniref:HNH endonuclease n=1 Tax=Mycobacterium montefiorense TaxID=154654 RepID=UPI000D59393E|nr:HNH endonuclease [Mycobacterium montefiorense]
MKRARRMLRRAQEFGVEAELVIPEEVFARDNWTCKVCGKKIPPRSRSLKNRTYSHEYDPLSPSIDHVIPHSAGGPHTYDNCTTVHRRCNSFKSSAQDYVHDDPNRTRRITRELPLDVEAVRARLKSQTVRQEVSERGRQLYGLKDDCLLWSGTKPNARGYAAMYLVGGKVRLVHRVAYEVAHGEGSIEGLTVDHLCGVPLCCNVKHLEAVSNEENVRRRSLWITHCVNGHEFTEENTYYFHTDGHRRCRQCNRDAYHLQTLGHEFVLDQENAPSKRARCLTCRLEKESTPQFCPYGHEYTADNDNDKRDKQGKRMCSQCRRDDYHLKVLNHEFVLDRSNPSLKRQRCLICYEAAENATHCPRSHEYTEFTMEYSVDGYRKCAQCRLDLLHFPRYGHNFEIDTGYTGKKRRCLECMRQKEASIPSHCKNGHEFTAETTTYHRTRGSRICVLCELNRSHVPATGHEFVIDPNHTGELRRCLTCKQQKAASRTHCANGHKFSPETTFYHTYTGEPRCVICKMNYRHVPTFGHEYVIYPTANGRRCLTCIENKQKESESRGPLSANTRGY